MSQPRHSEKEKIYWLWLDSAYSILLSRAPDILAYASNLERAYAAAKQIVMELWAIRTFFVKLGIAPDRLDQIAPNLKIFRDAIAHIEERAEGTMLVGRKKTELTPSKQSLAGGLLQTIDGVRWTGFNYCYGIIGSEDGLWTTFGLVRDWIITNTDQGVVELQLNEDLFKKLDELIRSEKRQRIEII